MLDRDYRELLSLFADSGVEYVLVGTCAMAAHGHAPMLVCASRRQA